MDKFSIEGPCRIKGRVKISGSKSDMKKLLRKKQLHQNQDISLLIENLGLGMKNNLEDKNIRKKCILSEKNKSVLLRINLNFFYA